ncbi:flagellar hook-length control protein FliK [Nocardioides pantholopis]|uniref:flagellar hook-length control protein FliK n=1 Tax=Nocardioides pantholopis TaxID=2483798 RepID=UPI000F07351E|nr:flagellar hook-length control protein FliK [Nocardioides pantholopis]
MSIQLTDLVPVAPARGTQPASRPGAREEGRRSFGDLLDSMVGERSVDERSVDERSVEGAPAGPASAPDGPPAGPDPVLIEAGLVGLAALFAGPPATWPTAVPSGLAPAAEAGAGQPLAGTGLLADGAAAAASGPALSPAGTAVAVDAGALPAGTPTTGAAMTLPRPAGPTGVADAAAIPVAALTPTAPSDAIAPVGAEGTSGAVAASAAVGTAPEADPGGTDAGDRRGAPGAGEPVAARPVEQTGPTAQAGSASVLGAPTVTPTGPPGPGGTATGPTPVSHQLFDAVTRATQTGEGSHRMTVRLDPGTLGEVRVHLVARDGALQVHLTAGPEALAALGDGSSELQRLLQSTGAVDVKVTVRDLGADQHRPDQHGPDHDGRADRPETSGTTGGSAGDRSGREQGEPTPAPDLLARMPGSATTQRGQGHGGPLPHHPTGSTPARVDLAL